MYLLLVPYLSENERVDRRPAGENDEREAARHGDDEAQLEDLHEQSRRVLGQDVAWKVRFWTYCIIEEKISGKKMS